MLSPDVSKQKKNLRVERANLKVRLIVISVLFTVIAMSIGKKVKNET